MALLGKKNKPKTSEKSTPSTSGNAANRSVFTYFMVPMVAIALSIGAAAWWAINQAIDPVNETHQQQLISQVGEQYEAYFNNALNQHRTLMQRLASGDQLTDLLQDASRAELDNAEARLVNNLPHGLAVHLFPPGEASQQPNASPPLAFAGLDMIRRTEQGQNLPWEAHQLDGEPYLHSVIAVRDGNGNLIGTLSVSQDMNYLEESLNGIDSTQGNVVVVQQFQGGGQQTLLTYGVKTSNRVSTLRSDHPNWSLTFQPSDELAQSTVFAATNLWATFGLIFVIALASQLVAASLLQAAMRHDVNLFVRFIQRVLSNQSVDHQPYRLGLFNTLAKSVNRLRMGKGNRPASPAAPVQGGPASGFTAPAPPPAKEADDDFEVNMLEGDDDILGMDSPAPTPMAHSSPVSADLFRADDIRGIMGETLDSEIARKIGLAIGSEALDRGEQTVVVARDGRLSSPELSQALIGGLVASGRDVIDIGVVPTPLAYFATHTLGTTSCVMVTGSHNPSNYNGFKIVLAGNTLATDEILGLHRRIEEERFHSGNGSTDNNEISANYINRITEDVKVSRPLKVVIDGGNGVAGNIAPKLIKSLGCHVLPLYCDVDGNFPNHQPDPSDPKNLQDLSRTVIETRADIGFAFDGGGDRIGLVTNSGKIIPADRLLMLLAKDLITRNPGATVIYDVKCSRRLQELIAGYGGKPLMWKTGHTHIKRKMKETNALLAGEMSGHIFYKERWYGFDDALYTACRLLEIISARGDSLDALFDSFPEDINTPEMAISAPDDRKLHIVEQLQRNAAFSGGQITDIDGLRVDFPDGWGLVRASNTTSTLVCRFGADTGQALSRIQDAFRSQLQAVDSQLQIPF
ncbi:phosphomannomutase/phosphoglucomutase [Saccharospirillum sp.]|uniref:phosphomannomutase/phosphoglucomutase n=1 Tax=Saccharospirillum sp. TaxID=2033801 RepID=UPI00349FEB1C